MNSYADDEILGSMARVRRKATAKTRLNFEIAGIAAIGIAVLLGIALGSRAGIAGSAVAAALGTSFGAAAPLFPVLVALFGAIVFLEINVPRMIGTFATASIACFLLHSLSGRRPRASLARAVDHLRIRHRRGAERADHARHVDLQKDDRAEE